MVHGIIIPADNTAPLRTATLDSLADYQRAIGGWIEAVDIPDLAVTMYVNEQGLIRDLPFNRRATFLWRFHVPQAHDARLVGDVAVVGLTTPPHRRRGRSTPCSAGEPRPPNYPPARGLDLS